MTSLISGQSVMPCFSTTLTPSDQFLIKVFIFDDKRVSEYGGDFNTLMKKHPNTKAYRALVDTGANGSCISEEVAQELELTPTCKKQMKTAGNPAECNEYDIHICIPVEEITSYMQVKRGERVVDMPSSAMMHVKSWKSSVFGLPQQDNERGYDCLLGMNVLKTCTFQYAQGIITICF